MDDVKAMFPLPVEPRPRLAFRPPYSLWQISALINWGRRRLWPSRIKWISGRTSRIPACCSARCPFGARPCRRNQWWSGWWNNNRWSRNTTTLRIERTQLHLPQSLSKTRSSPRRWDLFLRPGNHRRNFSRFLDSSYRRSYICNETYEAKASILSFRILFFLK